MKDKRARLLLLLALFVAYAVPVTIFLGSACPLYLVFGVPCPACGMTRAHLLFVTFRFGEAFAMHPLFLLSVPTAAYILLYTFAPQKMSNKAVKISMWLMIAALIVCYVVRMILYFPHTAPYNFNNASILGVIIHMFQGGGTAAAECLRALNWVKTTV